ncbi:MAG: hypothetical protein JSR80_04305 [Verrucomicrobia bacterium]|nr:hypothetical protein [Verrucomicrobiota bacterium]
MQGTASILEALCGPKPVNRDNYRDLLAGDGRNLYSTTPWLGLGKWYRLIASAQHPVVVDQSLHNVACVFQQTIEGIAHAHASFQQAAETLRNSSSENSAETYQFWGKELISLLQELERLEKDQDLLKGRWDQFREIAANLNTLSEQTPPALYLCSSSVRLTSSAIAFAGVAVALRRYQRTQTLSLWACSPLLPVVTFWPVALAKEPLENVDLPENGLDLLFEALRGAKDFSRLDCLHHEIGLFPPISAFAKLAQDVKQEDWTAQRLPQEILLWIEALNASCTQKEETPPIRLLHHVLLDFSEHFEGTPSETCAQIEWALKQGGCKIFDQEDPLHTKWVAELQPGMSIAKGEQQVILRESLGNGRWKLQNSDDIVIFHPLNEASLGIAQIEQAREHQEDGLTHAKIGLLMDRGRAAYFEHLTRAAERSWRGDETDQTYKETFLAEFKKLIARKKIPKGALEDLLHVNAQGQVRWLLGTKETEELDMEQIKKIEDYFRHCSDSDQNCFQYWMKETRLTSSPSALRMRANLVEKLRLDLSSNALYEHHVKVAIRDVRRNFEIPSQDNINNLQPLKERLLRHLPSCLEQSQSIVIPPEDLPWLLVQAAMLEKPYLLKERALEDRAFGLDPQHLHNDDFYKVGIYHEQQIAAVRKDQENILF